MRGLLLGLLACSLCLGGTWSTGQDPSLPDGKGIEKVRVHCSLCHGLEIVAQQRLSRAEWARVVDQMVEFGAPLSPGDRREILDYLTAYLGRGTVPPPGGLSPLRRGQAPAAPVPVPWRI